MTQTENPFERQELRDNWELNIQEGDSRHQGVLRKLTFECFHFYVHYEAHY